MIDDRFFGNGSNDDKMVMIKFSLFRTLSDFAPLWLVSQLVAEELNL